MAWAPSAAPAAWRCATCPNRRRRSADWQAGADTVALVNGALSGVVSVAGCLVAGWICDRMDRRVAYCLFGVLQVAVAFAMAWSARTTTSFIVWTTLYAFVTGLTYAGFSAVVLEAIGHTAVIEGHSNDRWGSRGMLLTEAAIATTAIVVFLMVVWATRRGAPARG